MEKGGSEGSLRSNKRQSNSTLTLPLTLAPQLAAPMVTHDPQDNNLKGAGEQVRRTCYKMS